MTELTLKEKEARNRVCLALDVPTVKDALDLSEELSNYVGIFKVGKQLHTVACKEGIPIVNEIYKRGGEIFLDLKFHDTPNTVYEAAIAACEPGLSMFNLHVEGEAMCKAAMKGAREGAKLNRIERPRVLGVTVLTSLDDSDLEAQGLNVSYNELVENRTELAKKWGLDGIVCPAKIAGNLESKGYDFIKVTPGIKWAGLQREGQKQLYTPDLAVRECDNSILVIGGAITTAGNVYEEKNGEKILVKKGTSEDRRKTAYEILQAMAENL